MSVLWGLVTAFAVSQGDGGQLTLEQALAIAYQNAFPVKTALSQLEKTRQQVNEARGHLGPQVTLGATDTLYAPGLQTFGPTSPAETSAKAGTATIALPVDISGNIGLALRAARAAVAAQEDNVEAAKLNLRRDVRKAYYNVLQAEEVVRVDQQALASAQQRLKDTEAQFRAGTAARVDVLRAEVQVSSAEIDLSTAKRNVNLAKQSFNNTLARPIETPFEPAPVTALPTVQASDTDLNNVAQKARPDLQGLKENAYVLALATKIQEGGLKPSLNFSATLQHNVDPSSGSRVSQTVGVIAISWPVFDSGITRAKVKEARQDEVQTQIAIQQLGLGISLEVRTALTNLRTAAERLKLAEQQVTVAEEAFRLSNVRRDAGEGILVEVIDAQTDLTRARQALVSARYDYLAAYADLQRAVGIDQVQDTTVNGGSPK